MAMEQILRIAIGLIISGCAWVSIPLSCFIGEVEDGTVCIGCIGKDRCFAKKEIKILHSDYMSEWMLFSFLMIRKQCPCIQKCSMKDKVWNFVFCFILFVLPFWSRGMDDIGFLYGISAVALFFLSIVDWNTQYIPLEMSGILFICGLIQVFVDLSNWLEYVIGLFAVSGFLLCINNVFTPLLRKRYAESNMEIDSAIGDGDIKLMAATGLLLGWKLNFLALGIGCMAGSVIHLIRMKVKKGERQFALGPYLSLGVYITMIYGKQLVSWYMSMMGVEPY